MEERAKCLIEVTAGVVPGITEPEYTRLYAITSSDWEKARASETIGGEEILLAETAGKAQAYAALLMNPSNRNWVKIDWLWL